ncbi:MAG TPA: hypothetical protein VGK73_14730 [Polyangiaceae bacterium]
MHVDEFIDRHGGDNYARWMLLHFRLPAILQLDFGQFIADKRLFCTYDGCRYRCTGASRLGDVWLADNFDRETGYDLRVDVDKCTDWSAEP